MGHRQELSLYSIANSQLDPVFLFSLLFSQGICCPLFGTWGDWPALSGELLPLVATGPQLVLPQCTSSMAMLATPVDW